MYGEWKFIGDSNVDVMGGVVCNVGDVNGDGYDDIMIGVYGADSISYINVSLPLLQSSGLVYIIFGTRNQVSNSFQLSHLNGTRGFIIYGVHSYDYFGCAVSSAGDFNGDGYDDILIGAYGADPNENSAAGKAYLIFGHTNIGNVGRFDLSDLENGLNGVILNGINAYDYSGYAVSSAGDFNGDGYDDILIGGYGADGISSYYGGETYLIYGTNMNINNIIELSALDGLNGVILNGISAYDYSGYAVSSAGDFNGDGYDDILIGAYGADGSNTNSGESYLVFGGLHFGNNGEFDLNQLDGVNGCVIHGTAANAYSGYAVSSAGDFNGDGYDDILIGAYGVDHSRGASYVVFGQRESFGAVYNISDIADNHGVILNGINAYDYSGYAVSSAGDFNGDGYDDILIGAYGADGSDTNSGESYLVFGGPSVGSNDGTIEIVSLDGQSGMLIKGQNAYDYSGYAVSSAGDFNGDGYDDILIGGYGASEVYLIFYLNNELNSSSSSSSSPSSVPDNTIVIVLGAIIGVVLLFSLLLIVVPTSFQKKKKTSKKKPISSSSQETG